jgi:hypothetical protein
MKPPRIERIERIERSELPRAAASRVLAVSDGHGRRRRGDARSQHATESRLAEILDSATDFEQTDSSRCRTGLRVSGPGVFAVNGSLRVTVTVTVTDYLLSTLSGAFYVLCVLCVVVSFSTIGGPR